MAATGSSPVDSRPSVLGSSPAIAVDAGLGQTTPAWFEQVYRSAAGDAAAVPWANLRSNPMMVSWLNTQASGLVRPGSRVAVVGCGLGDDVAELAGRGYDAVGFDVSPTAVEWARRRFPSLSASLIHADLFALPGRLLRRFDLVVEVYTLQAIAPGLREDAARRIASLATSKGLVLAICRGREEGELMESIAGPPWPLTRSELVGLMEAAGLHPVFPVDSFLDDEDPPVPRLRGVFGRR